MTAAAIESAFAAHRAAIWKLCYRMTGSAADADDLVQETFARAVERPPADLDRDLGPWLVQVAANLSRDQLRRRKRRGYTGPWLPSPIELPQPGGEARDPEARYGELESLSFAFLCALEALTPAQRAVLVLRDALGYSVEETARALARTDANVKTTHHRARAAMAGYDRERPRLGASAGARTQAVLEQLLACLVAHDVQGLEALLARDVLARNDSDGEYFAARVPIAGKAKVIKFHLNVAADRPIRFALHSLNGQPALVAEYVDAQPGVAPRFVFRIELDAEDRVRELQTIVASRKLSHVRFDGLQLQSDHAARR